jgi:hypothetical protein
MDLGRRLFDDIGPTGQRSIKRVVRGSCVRRRRRVDRKTVRFRVNAVHRGRVKTCHSRRLRTIPSVILQSAGSSDVDQYLNRIHACEDAKYINVDMANMPTGGRRLPGCRAWVDVICPLVEESAT